MTVDRESHWATVIGCDMRAGFSEIQRAANRRAREVLDGPLRGEALAIRLQEISDALTRAKAEKSAGGRRRSRAGRFEE